MESIEFIDRLLAGDLRAWIAVIVFVVILAIIVSTIKKILGNTGAKTFLNVVKVILIITVLVVAITDPERAGVIFFQIVETIAIWIEHFVQGADNDHYPG